MLDYLPGADWLIAFFCFAPWLIFFKKLYHVTAYEWRIKLFAELQLFDFPGLLRRIRQRRGIDPAYNRLRLSTHRWFVISIGWWCVSVTCLAGLMYLASH